MPLPIPDSAVEEPPERPRRSTAPGSGFAQYLAMLPGDLHDFLRFCVETQSVPLLEVTDTGVNADARLSRLRQRDDSAGPLLVSMRPFARGDIHRASEISSRFPAMHGGPVHAGNPAELGIVDLNAPDFGDPVRLAPDEIPVFWACGVTAQIVALEARPSLAIFHAPGHMFITDRPHVDFHRQEEGHDNP
jgi:uncharacterized protein YcsI (UPF0317 family)